MSALMYSIPLLVLGASSACVIKKKYGLAVWYFGGFLWLLFLYYMKMR